jgi:hypothetical protein
MVGSKWNTMLSFILACSEVPESFSLITLSSTITEKIVPRVLYMTQWAQWWPIQGLGSTLNKTEC